jgi:hypothetical protein
VIFDKYFRRVIDLADGEIVDGSWGCLKAIAHWESLSIYGEMNWIKLGTVKFRIIVGAATEVRSGSQRFLRMVVGACGVEERVWS